MKLLSIQVGKIQTVDYAGEAWTSAYRKLPVSGAVYVDKLHVAGDEQHHKKFHGGVHRPVLMYAAAHYATWKAELGYDLPYGSFAENFTVEGMDEDTVCIGDVFQVGEGLVLQVSQPRQPCEQIYKALSIEDIVKRIKASHRSGWYLRVLQEGYAEAAMPILRLEQPFPEWTISRVHQVMTHRSKRKEEATELSRVEALEPKWRQKLADAGKAKEAQ
jgi:MOSC domain-containing protein YiiM